MLFRTHAFPAWCVLNLYFFKFNFNSDWFCRKVLFHFNLFIWPWTWFLTSFVLHCQFKFFGICFVLRIKIEFLIVKFKCFRWKIYVKTFLKDQVYSRNYIFLKIRSSLLTIRYLALKRVLQRSRFKSSVSPRILTILKVEKLFYKRIFF